MSRLQTSRNSIRGLQMNQSSVTNCCPQLIMDAWRVPQGEQCWKTILQKCCFECVYRSIPNVCVCIYVISECPELETKKLCYTLNIFIFIYELKKYFLLELRTANIIKEDKICISFLVSQSYLFLLH